MTSEHVARKRAARIDEILDAAEALVVGDGLEALTLQRLAGELGIATSALYRYFPGKAELMVALQLRAIDALAVEVIEAIEGAKTPLAGARAAFTRFAEEPERAPARHRLVDAFLSAPSEQLGTKELLLVEERLAPLLERVARCLHAAEEDGSLAPGDARVRTRLAWAALHGLHHLRRRDRVEPKALKTGALTRAMIDTLLAGWGAKG